VTTSDFLRSLEELLDREPGRLKPEDKLDSIAEWDSLAVVSFIGLADKMFGVSVSATKIAEARTVSDLIALLGDRVS